MGFTGCVLLTCVMIIYVGKAFNMKSLTAYKSYCRIISSEVVYIPPKNIRHCQENLNHFVELFTINYLFSNDFCFCFSFQYSLWNLLWIGWNVFLICFYLSVGVLDRVSILLNMSVYHLSLPSQHTLDLIRA